MNGLASLCARKNTKPVVAIALLKAPPTFIVTTNNDNEINQAVTRAFLQLTWERVFAIVGARETDAENLEKAIFKEILGMCWTKFHGRLLKNGRGHSFQQHLDSLKFTEDSTPDKALKALKALWSTLIDQVQKKGPNDPEPPEVVVKKDGSGLTIGKREPDVKEWDDILRTVFEAFSKFKATTRNLAINFCSEEDRFMAHFKGMSE